MNLYEYCRSNPWAYLDPFGLQTDDPCLDDEDANPWDALQDALDWLGGLLSDPYAALGSMGPPAGGWQPPGTWDPNSNPDPNNPFERPGSYHDGQDTWSWHPPDTKHPKGHWDKQRRGKKTEHYDEYGNPIPIIAPEPGWVVSAAGAAWGAGKAVVKTAGKVLDAAEEFAYEHPRLGIGIAVVIIVVDVADFPSGEGIGPGILIIKAATVAPAVAPLVQPALAP